MLTINVIWTLRNDVYYFLFCFLEMNIFNGWIPQQLSSIHWILENGWFKIQGVSFSFILQNHVDLIQAINKIFILEINHKNAFILKGRVFFYHSINALCIAKIKAEIWIRNKGIDVDQHERLSNFTFGHKSM